MKGNWNFEINGVKFRMKECSTWYSIYKFDVFYYSENMGWLEIGSVNNKRKAIQVAKRFLIQNPRHKDRSVED